MCACHADQAAVTGAGDLQGHMEVGGARVVTEATGVPVADVYMPCGSKHDNQRAYADMCTVSLHSAADMDPTTNEGLLRHRIGCRVRGRGHDGRLRLLVRRGPAGPSGSACCLAQRGASLWDTGSGEGAGAGVSPRRPPPAD
jgi:hypothetical protein